CKRILATMGMILLSSSLVASQIRDRETTPAKYQWDLTHLYASDEAWSAEKSRIQQEMEKISGYKGRLAQSPTSLYEALELSTQLNKEMARLYSYASMKSDQDTRVTRYAGMKQELQQLFSVYGALASYMEPELLSLSDEELQGF